MATSTTTSSPGLTVAMIMFGVIVSSLFIVLNIYKPSALVAVAFMYLVFYSAMVLLLLNSYQKAFGNNNLHYTLDWYISFFNIFLGIIMFGLYFFMSNKSFGNN